MTDRSPHTARSLFKGVAMLQLKLLLDALRDLLLVPVALVAAGLDLAMLKRRQPTYFRAVLRFGEHTDQWIDVWSGGRDPDEAPQHENVDRLMERVENIVRDPQVGARHARVLKRWAERQLARARQRAAQQISARLPPPRPSSQEEP